MIEIKHHGAKSGVTGSCHELCLKMGSDEGFYQTPESAELATPQGSEEQVLLTPS